MNVVAVSGFDKKFNILSPIGGFGNHVRWLLLLDPEFQFLIKGTAESYNNQRGPDWPDYNDYKLSIWDKTLPEIKNEIIGIFGEYDCINTSSKIKFIQEQVYPVTRSWHNWLILEWTYRRDLDVLIDFKHKFLDLSDSSLPTVLLTIDPDLAYKSYLKFNSNLNNCTRDVFKSNHVGGVTKKNIADCQNKTCVIDVGVLFQPTLDKDFYFQLTTSLGLADQYAEANYVHGLWYQAHKRSEQEFVNDISTIYK